MWRFLKRLKLCHDRGSEQWEGCIGPSFLSTFILVAMSDRICILCTHTYVIYVCTWLRQPACWSSLSQSVIQVRPTGSGLMRIGSVLSGSWPGVEAVCGAQEKKRNAAEHSRSPSLEMARDAANRSDNSDLSMHNNTAQCFEFLWSIVTLKPQKKSKQSIEGVLSANSSFLLLWIPFLSCSFTASPYSRPKQGNSPWQTWFKVMLMPPSLFKWW